VTAPADGNVSSQHVVNLEAPPDTRTSRREWLRQRWRVALVLAAVTGGFAIVRFLRASGAPSDLDQLWYAARALVHGNNPYDVVGPGRLFQWLWPLFYPLPAVVLAVPFSFLPIAAARIVFSVVSAGALGFAVGPRWRVTWPMFLSTSYFLAISRNQWSPLLLASIWLPSLGFVIAAKPNVGFVTLAAQNRRNAVWAASLALGLTLACVLLRPSWPREWYAIVRSLPNQTIALLQPGGFVLLAAVLLWRTVEGRIFLAAALVPQTPALYDALPLFAVCRTTRQTLVLTALTHIMQWALIASGPFASFDAAYAQFARLYVPVVLIPLLITVFASHRGRIAALGAPPPETNVPEATVRWSRLDRALAAMLCFSLGVQLWLAFRP
jgi:hypothetical protein